MTPRRDPTERRMRRLTGRPADWTAFLRLRRRRGDRPRRSRRATRALLIVGGVFILLLAWAALDVRAARRELLSARAELSAASSNLGSATDAAAAARLHTATQHAVAQTAAAQRRLRRLPLLRVAGIIPGLSTQRDGLFRAVRVANDAAKIGDRLTGQVEALRDGLTVHNSSVDLAAVKKLSKDAHDAGAALGKLPRTHRGGQWSPLANATRDLDGVLSDTTRRLTRGADTMGVTYDLLGGNGARRLLIALQNNAEMRDQGMVLSVAVADASNGSLHVTRSGTVQDLALARPVTDVTLPQSTRDVFGSLIPLQYWQSVNASADTALAGATMRSMYKAATGDTIDGVIALDVPAVAKLLAVTGPVTVDGIGEVSAANADQLLLNDLYANRVSTADIAARREQLSDVLAAVITRIQASAISATSLISALGDASAGGHMWATSARPDDQRALERAGLSGTPGRVLPERTIHISVQNGSGSKVDWFVDPKVDVDVSVTPDGTAVVRTRVTIPNASPANPPASEQFGPYLDGDTAGEYRARVYFWGPSTGDQLNSVFESGLRLNFALAQVLPGESKTVEFSTAIPNAVKNGHLRLRLVPQARVRPIQLHITVSGLGWKVDGAGSQTLPWDHTLNMSWRLSR